MYVWLEASDADSPGPSPTVDRPSTDRSELVESLQDQVSYLREQLEAERAANRENRRLLAAALERIPAIEPPETPGEPQTPSEGAERENMYRTGAKRLRRA